MLLNDLLNIENPTLEQYSETEKALTSVSQHLGSEIARLDEEHRVHSADRILNRDTGQAERIAARAAAELRKADIERVLMEVRFKRASLENRLAKEADSAAWAKVKQALEARRGVMKQIDDMFKDAVVLHTQQQAYWDAAVAAAPVKIQREDYPHIIGFGRSAAETSVALLGRLNMMLGFPVRPGGVNDQELAFSGRRVSGGLDDYLFTLEDTLLKYQR